MVKRKKKVILHRARLTSKLTAETVAAANGGYRVGGSTGRADGERTPIGTAFVPDDFVKVFLTKRDPGE